MADREIRVRLAAEIQSYQQGLRTAAGATAEFGKEITGLQSNAAVNLEKVGRGAMIMSGVMAAGLGLALKSAVDWESAWAGVLKTVDGTDEELSSLEAGLRSLAQELPASHTEIAAVAEAAGQLGISVGGVEKFTKTMIDLGETTNLSAEQAATSLARFSNIMGTTEGDIDRIGSTIVELGNNSATTEAEIVELGTRLAAAGAIAGLSEADVLAFASTLTSVGVEAEAGGTALSKVFTSVRDAVLDGSDSLDTFAEVAGVTTDEFSRQFRDDAAGAVAMFIEGLGRMNAAGQSTSQVFSDLSLTDQRLMRALLSTAEAGGLLAEQLDMAGVAWEDNTALALEANKRYETTAAQMEILRNKVVDFGIDIGSVLLPMLGSAVGLLDTFVEGMAAMPGPMKTVLTIFAGLATAGLGTVGVMATMIPKLQAARKALMGMGTAGQFLGRNMGAIGAGAGVATLAVGTLTFVLGRHAERVAKAEARITGWADAIREAGDVAEGTATHISNLVGESTALAAGMAEADLTVKDMNAALQEGGDAWDEMRGKILQGADAAGVGGESLFYLNKDLGQMRGELGKAASQAENTAKAQGGMADATDDATESVQRHTSAAEASAEATKEQAEAIKGLADQLQAQFDPLFAAQKAMDDLATAQLDAAAAAEEFGADSIEAAAANRKAVEAALSNRTAMINLKAAVEAAGGSVDDAVAILFSWVKQGIITRDQAAQVADEFRKLEGEAKGLDGLDIRMGVGLDGASDVENTLAWLARDRTARIRGDVYYVPTSQGGGRITLGAATGGYIDGGPKPIYRAAGGPIGTDTVPAWLTPGEYVLRKSAVDSLGVGLLHDLNREGMNALRTRYMTEARPPTNVTVNISSSDQNLIRDGQFWAATQLAGV